jgi:hypothetical protein
MRLGLKLTWVSLAHAGKRISMRRVIAYIASHFRKDKIWLRRSRPDKRRYQVQLMHGTLGSCGVCRNLSAHAAESLSGKLWCDMSPLAGN